MKLQKNVLFLLALIAFFAFSCTSDQSENEETYASETYVPDIDFTSVDSSLVKKFPKIFQMYRGHYRWTITGDYEVKESAFPTAQTKRLVLQNVHWSWFISYSAEEILTKHFGRDVVEGSVDFHRYDKRPALPKKTDALDDVDKNSDR